MSLKALEPKRLHARNERGVGMKQTSRTRKLNESLKEVIALILVDAIADPRLDLVTVTAVRVSPDLSIANVYVTAHGDSDRYAEVIEGLESAKGRIRGILGGKIKMRLTPELRFFIDDSVDQGMLIAAALQHVPPSMTGDGDSIVKDNAISIFSDPEPDA